MDTGGIKTDKARCQSEGHAMGQRGAGAQTAVKILGPALPETFCNEGYLVWKGFTVSPSSEARFAPQYVFPVPNVGLSGGTGRSTCRFHRMRRHVALMEQIRRQHGALETNYNLKWRSGESEGCKTLLAL